MTPLTQPSTELVRMIANTKKIYGEKEITNHLRQCSLTLAVNQIQFVNKEGVDFNRVLSRTTILQNSPMSKEKVVSIFTPVIDNLCCQFWSSEKIDPNSANRSVGENILVEATASIYSFVESISKEINCKTIVDRNRRILITPKIK